LPNPFETITEGSTFFQYGKAWFYLSPEGTIHRVTRAYIIANGTHDLCIARGDGIGNNNVKKIGEADKDYILYIPQGDILWINITPPYKGSRNSIILDIGSDKKHTKPLVMAILKSLNVKPETRGDQYDTYLGEKYWDEGNTKKNQTNG